MFRVVLETDAGTIEIQDRPKPQLGDNATCQEKMDHVYLPSILVIRVGGKEYGIPKNEFQVAVKPFLPDEQ